MLNSLPLLAENIFLVDIRTDVGTSNASDFWVSKVEGVNMKESSGSVDTGKSGREFIIEQASAKKVVNTS